MIPHINTQDGITVVLYGKPYHVAKDHRDYEEVVDSLYASEDEVLELVEKVKIGVKNALPLSAALEYSDGVVTYYDEPLHGYAVDKLVELIGTNNEITPLCSFLERLQNNPSMQTREDLYTFLEHGKMPLTEHGTFLAYKAIRENWTDIHTGTFDNSIGARPRMERSLVNDRREVTCSRGFHVCSYDYLPFFSHADGHVVVVEVDPADVVSIPQDYSNTKMRVAGYSVIGEIQDWYTSRANVLADHAVYEEEYVVFMREYEDEEWEYVDHFDNIDEAKDFAHDMLLDKGNQVKVKQEATEITVFFESKE